VVQSALVAFIPVARREQPSGRDLYLPVVPGLGPIRFRLEILSRPQSSFPNPWATCALGKVAVPSGEFAQFIRIGHVDLLQMLRGVAD
jgi:hypothetical protein